MARWKETAAKPSSLGLNWYPTEYLKLMFNGTHIEREEVADGTESEALIQTRMQVYF